MENLSERAAVDRGLKAGMLFREMGFTVRRICASLVAGVPAHLTVLAQIRTSHRFDKTVSMRNTGGRGLKFKV